MQEEIYCLKMGDTWDKTLEEPLVQEFIKKKKQKLAKVWRGKLLAGRNDYFRRKKRGDYSYMVDEWDLFELERDREKMKQLEENNIKGEIKIMEKRISVELTKEFNKVVVGVDNVLEIDDFETAKDWAWNEAMSVINRIPDGGFGKSGTPKQVSKETYTKEKYPQKEYAPKPSKSYVTASDITTKFLKGGQIGVAVKRINKGEITLEQVNNATSWEHANSIVFSFAK